jgi:hypothetical protein
MQAQFRKLALMKQEPNESLEKFDKQFDEQLKVTEQQWGIPYKLRDETKAIQLQERNQFIACLFLGSVDHGRYKAAIDELANDFTLGNNNYPKDIPGMVSMLSNRCGGSANKRIDELKDGIFTSFHQSGTKKCSYCKKSGHTVDECSRKKKSKQYTSFGKGQGNPFENRSDSDSEGSNSRYSNRKGGWFKENDSKGKSGYIIGFQIKRKS